MPFQIIRNDITQMHVDIIVNATNPSMYGDGGVDSAIHRAAGPGLLAECRMIGTCETGDAKITNAYALPCRWVIHTVGPVWQGGNAGEARILASCYRKCLELTTEKGCDAIAFPLISTGTYGYPKEEALRIAEEAIMTYLNEENPDMLVFLVIYDKESFTAGEERFSDIRAYIDDHYIASQPQQRGSGRLIGSSMVFGNAVPPSANSLFASAKASIQPAASARAETCSLEEALQKIDESFAEMLLRKIDERGMTDAQCYKKANIDRKLFSKIRSDRLYHPRKTTVIAFALALELNLDETKEMLMKAGFALSHSSKFDIIVEYYISRGIYDILEINNTLFAFDQVLISGYDKAA